MLRKTYLSKKFECGENYTKLGFTVGFEYLILWKGNKKNNRYFGLWKKYRSMILISFTVNKDIFRHLMQEEQDKNRQTILYECKLM